MIVTDEIEELKQELIDIVTRSLNIGLKHGVITREEYIQSMREVSDMKNDSPEEIRALIHLLIVDRNQREYGNGDDP